MKPIFFFVAILTLLLNTVSIAQHDSTQTEEEQYEMRTYYMVFLWKGPNRTQDSVTAVQIQKDHLANISRLAKEGKLAIAGPFLDNTDLRGIFILTVDSMEEAKKLCDTDPAIKAGRLRAEIHPWYSARGSKLP